MKKRVGLLVIISIFAVLMLSGCTASSKEAVAVNVQESTESEVSRIQDGRIQTWTDPETGVQYLIYFGYNGRGGMCPRLNTDGSVCIEENMED